MTKIVLPQRVKDIVETLENGGYEAYAVGGCIRDSLLGRIPNDWDVTTNATPAQVKKLFRRTVDTGIVHGTVTVMIKEEGFEITTYRIDGNYSDGRHPDAVSYTGELKEDLRRRDFTINAMAYNDTSGLVDLFGGQEDLEKRRIRCVGDPQERFLEDALRMLRAVRFAGQLNFHIEEDTVYAIQELAGNLEKVSKERIREELTKLLLSPCPEKLMLADQCGITKAVLPWFYAQSPIEKARVFVGIQGSAHWQGEDSEKDQRILRYGYLLWKAKESPQTILRDLKFDNETMEGVCHLLKFGEYSYELTPVAMRLALHEIGEEKLPRLLAFQLGLGEQNPLLLKKAGEMAEEIHRRGECTTLREMALTGKDLLEIGMTPGKKMGEMLEQLLLEVMEEPEKNKKETLLNRAKEIMK